MELSTLEAFGKIDHNLCLLNSDEYAFIAGAFVVVKRFKSTGTKSHRFLRSLNSHFTAMDFNHYKGLLATCESGRSATIRLFSYLEKNGFGESPKLNHVYKPVSEATISKAMEVTHLSFAKDGSRIVALIPEPMMQMKVFDINENNQMTLISSVPLKTNFSACRICPVNKNMVFLLHEDICQIIELKDCFNKEYRLQLREVENAPEKVKEEQQVEKRYVISRLDHPTEIDKFLDFAWDSYSNIYITLNSGDIFLYDSAFNIITGNCQGEIRESIKLSSAATAICMTQRHLACFQEDGKIVLVNPWIYEADLPSFKLSIGNPESYRAFDVDKEITASIFSSEDQEIDMIKMIRYDPEMNKLVGLSVNSLYVFLLKAEILMKEKEKENESDDRGGITKDIDSYEETKFHSGRIIAVRELGYTTQFVTLGEDKKIIFWELTSRTATLCHELEFIPTCLETETDGNLIFIGSSEGVLRVYDISNRNVFKLIHMIKYGENEKKELSIDRIIAHPAMKYLVFFKKGDNCLYFVSGNTEKEFSFLGYLRIPSGILDIAIVQEGSSSAQVLVLIKNFLILYKVQEFKSDHKKVLEITPTKSNNLFNNFELPSEMKIRKVDGDLNTIINNMESETVWLSGTEKCLRQYQLPQESLDSIKKNSKSPTENPLKDFKAHELDVVTGIVKERQIVTIGKDGTIQIRKEEREKYEKFNRTHSYITNGISSFCFSNKQLLYTSGYDGSIIISGFTDEVDLPVEPVYPLASTESLDGEEAIDFLEDRFVKAFYDIAESEHNLLVKKAKKTQQLPLKEKLEDIKSEISKLIEANSLLDEIEQLSNDEIIIDLQRIDKEKKDGLESCNAHAKQYFRELCEKELKKEKLFENTYEIMKIKDPNSNKVISNNNISIVSSSSGDRVLKTYPLRNLSAQESERLNYVKQLRLMELNEKYKRRNEGIKEVIDETLFSKGNEAYLINRHTGKILLSEFQIRPADVAISTSGDGMDKGGSESGTFKTAKYKLQRNPYADEMMIGGKAEDNADDSYKADEQLLKEDLNFKFNTLTENQGINDIEFKHNLQEIESSALLYSPFELNTNFRMRNQIYLLLDIIQGLKASFNKDFKVFIAERNQYLEKFNLNKQAIDVIKETLISLGGEEVPPDDYSYIINPHEDNEWVEKKEESEIKVPKYFSREEKIRQEEEKRREEERLKAMQGDTLQMRGLKEMIEYKNNSANQNESEEKAAVKESWMDKNTNDMTQEELKKYTEHMRKKNEQEELKVKLRSQNMTKLKSHKMDIDTIKTDMDSKFIRILKKKLYYDYRITEQEIIILSLQRTMDYRNQIKTLLESAKTSFEKASHEDAEISDVLRDFSDQISEFSPLYKSVEEFYNTNNKTNKLVELDKNLEYLEPNDYRDEYLIKIRSDPFYFALREQFKKEKKYGNKAYEEININKIKPIGNNVKEKTAHEENIKHINNMYYYAYKNRQLTNHENHLLEEKDKLKEKKDEEENKFIKLSDDVKKSKLNFELALRVKKGQDEISGIEGPHEHVDECLLIESMKIDKLNKDIDKIYHTLEMNSNKQKDQNKILQYIDLETTKIMLTRHEIKLKLRYLKLTRVTKKIQEIVTGKEDMNPRDFSPVYKRKKIKLEENKKKRIERMNDKLQEISNEIEKKKKENMDFIEKYHKLNLEVKSKEQIINLGDDTTSNNTNQAKSKNKSLEIAQVTKLKNLVQQYYEEIEYLRSELDRLRARTFPSFLQKPDQIIFPDDK